MKQRFFVSLVCLFLFASTILASCAGGGNGGTQTGETTVPTSGTTAGATQATTAETTQATTAATTSGTGDPQRPLELSPVIESENQNQVLARLDTPITVEIYNGVTRDLDYIGWPTICRGEGNTLYAVGSVRTEHVDIYGAVGFTKSTDGGETWEPLRLIKDTPLDDRDSGVVYLGGGHLLVTWFTHHASLYREGKAYGGYRARSTPEQCKAVDARLDALTAEEQKDGSYVMHSYDGGKTWGEPMAVPVTAPHGPTLGQDGQTLYYAGIRKGDAGSKLTGNSVHVFKSLDWGHTWILIASVLNPMDANGNIMPSADVSEPYIIQLQDGSFLLGLRYNPNFMGVYLSRSANGVRWTPFEQIEGLEGSPPHLLQLQNGAIVLTYSYRVGGAQRGIRARISYDGGETWGREIIVEMKGTFSSNEDLGYPSTVELDDGTLITVYYQAYQRDYPASILYTKWRLEPAEE